VAKSQALDKFLIAVEISPLEVVQELPPLPDHHKKTSAGMEILLVGFQVLREAANPVSQYCDLDFRRARVSTVNLVLLDDFLFLFTFDHGDTPFLANPESQKGAHIPDPSAGSEDILPFPQTLCKKTIFCLSTS